MRGFIFHAIVRPLMNTVFSGFFYGFVFFALYVQVFFLYTFLRKKGHLKPKFDHNRSKHSYPKVSVIVPCWNEEKTVEGTVRSLLNLDYPKNKVQLFLVDDGSTDSTWEKLQQFKGYPNITLIKKDNGGKHTAMNLALEGITTEFVSCLDADSFVKPDALKRMIPHFDDPEVMAVCPTIVIHKPKTLIERAQKSEYELGAYVKKMLGIVGGIHVTPGPLSVYRRKVFEKVGPYRHAHSTEDMEIAYRMHESHLRIEQCHDAIVYTKAPKTAYKLYKQRLRWIYGFINNTIDYRRLIFRKRYGAFSLFTIPAGVISLIAAMIVFSRGFYLLGKAVAHKVEQIRTVGINFSVPSLSFDWFFINTTSVLFITVLLYGFILVSLTIGSKITRGKKYPSLSFVWYFTFFSILAPLWIFRALFNTITGRKTAWR